MGASVRLEGNDRIARNVQAMRQQGASEQDIEAYMRDVEGLTPENDKPAFHFNADPLIPYAPHSKPAPTSYGGGEEKAGMIHRALAEVPFATKSMAAIDALGSATKAAVRGRSLSDVAAGKPGGFLNTLEAAYNQNYDARKAAIETFKQEHPTQSKIAAGVGILAPIVATMGTSTAAEAPTLAARLSQGARTGAFYGALQGASNAHGSLDDYEREILQGGALGAVGGGIVAPVVGKAAQIVGKPIGKAVSATSDYLAERFPETQVLRRIANATGTKGRASDRLGIAAEMDTQAGFVPNDAPKGFPAIALDRAGPAVEGVAEGIANRVGAGRSILTKALLERRAGMRGTVSNAFDKGTGTTQESGEALLQRMAIEHAALEKAATIGKTLATEDRASSRVRPTQPNVLAAWRDELGGTFTDGIRALRQAIADKNAVAAEAFGAARAATQGQSAETPTLNALRETPIGRMAENWARVQKANRMRSLPTVSEPDEATMSSLLAMGVPAEKAAQFGGTVEREALDAETVHFMKQFLAKASRLGVHDGQGGTIATQAQGALNVWGRVRDELPEAFRHADEVTAPRFRIIEALNLGRDLMRSQLNPSGNKAVHTSIDAIAERVGGMAAQEQQAFRVGAQSSVTAYLRTAVRSPQSLVRQLNEPTSALSQRIVLATGDAGAPARLANRLTAQETRVMTVAPPPTSGAISPASNAAARGLDVLKHKVSPPGNAPERSLSVLERDVRGMTPDAQRDFRQGVAQAVRGEFAGKSVKSPGRVFGSADDPERLRQVRLAFPNDASAGSFQDLVGAYDRSAQQTERILGNSRTGFRNALEASRRDEVTPGALRELLSGHPRTALNQIGAGSMKKADALAQQKEDEVIAKWLANPEAATTPQVIKNWLTSPEAAAIPEALRTMVLRRMLRQETRTGLAKAGGSALGAQARD